MKASLYSYWKEPHPNLPRTGSKQISFSTKPDAFAQSKEAAKEGVEQNKIANKTNILIIISSSIFKKSPNKEKKT
ncbi:hypothetical protein [Bordetella trematum]|uniref:hypothetical protein n=1 Tax=Bordetella trematum TaxID=123899 RepID=UPI003AF3DEC2